MTPKKSQPLHLCVYQGNVLSRLGAALQTLTRSFNALIGVK